MRRFARNGVRVAVGIGIGLLSNMIVLSQVSARFWTLEVAEFISPSGPDGHGSLDAPVGIKWWGGATPDDPRIGVIFLLINFLVLLWILNRLIFRPLIARNRERSDRIRSELEAATKARSEADQILAESRSRLQQLQKEIENIKREAREIANRARAKILEEARSEAESILESARENMKREAVVARQQLETEILGQAIERAEQMITQRFVQADQDRLVQAYIKEIRELSLTNQPLTIQGSSNSRPGEVQ